MKTKEQKQNRNFIVLNISVILLLIAMAMSSAVSAQPPGGGGGGQQGPPPIPNSKQIKKMVSKLSSELSLSEQQETKVLALYQDHYEQVEEATSNGRPDRTKMEALKTSFEKNVKSELTEEQQDLYTEYLKKNQPQQRRGQPE